MFKMEETNDLLGSVYYKDTNISISPIPILSRLDSDKIRTYINNIDIKMKFLFELEKKYKRLKFITKLPLFLHFAISEKIMHKGNHYLGTMLLQDWSKRNRK